MDVETNGSTTVQSLTDLFSVTISDCEPGGVDYTYEVIYDY